MRTASVVLTVIMLATAASAADDYLGFLGFEIGLGAGASFSSSETLDEGLAGTAFLAHCEVGISLWSVAGLAFTFGFGQFEWPMTDERTIRMANQTLTADAYGIIPLGDNWRLRPAAGWTFDYSLTDQLGTGFTLAQGLHIGLAVEYRLNEIMWLGISAGHHFLGDFGEITINDPDYDNPDTAAVENYTEVFAEVVFAFH